MDKHPAHPLTTRIAHWTNAIVIVILLWSGFSMFSGDRHYATFVHLLPAWIWNALQLTGHRKLALVWHERTGIALATVGILYLVASTRARAWRTWSQYHLPQRAVYAGVLSGGALMVLTGFALWFRHQLPWLLAAMGGQRLVLPVHIVLATGLLGFIGVHLLQVARAGWPTLRAMLTGRPPRLQPQETLPQYAQASATSWSSKQQQAR
ncbi:MAG TPA: cytochrome b/b6 domain-containing protein [Candidatus Baltobacteraceae bacterium]|nr:cytochrome b/b6 domain-containing protein [Candidatus Baltobacteraceae bacterium]